MQGKKANGVQGFWNSTAPPVRCLLQEAKKKLKQQQQGTSQWYLFLLQRPDLQNY